MHLVLALMACTGADPQPQPSPEPAVDPEPAPDPPAPEDPRPGMHIEPLGINWDADSKALAVEAHLVGQGVKERKEAVHIGVTAITETDKEVDLLVHTLFPAAMGETVLFSADLEENPKHILIGAWNTKVEPCESTRPGCVDFGFVLDGSIASFPAKLYTEGMRQRFVPDGLEIQVKGDAKSVEMAANEYAKVFGTKVKTTEYSGALGAGVWAGQRDDLGLAHGIADTLGGLEYAQKDGLPAPLVVVLP